MNANLEGLFEDKADAVVIILGAKRDDGEHITDAQKDAAMNAAKSVLQIVGADVVANASTLCANPDYEEGSALKYSVDVDVEPVANETDDDGEED